MVVALSCHSSVHHDLRLTINQNLLAYHKGKETSCKCERHVAHLVITESVNGVKQPGSRGCIVDEMLGKPAQLVETKRL